MSCLFNINSENLILIAVVVILILVVLNRKNELFTVPADYVACESGNVCDYDGSSDVYFGTIGKTVVTIDPSQLQSLPNKKFTCLPNSYAGINGNPALPVIDPDAFAVKTCYVKSIPVSTTTTTTTVPATASTTTTVPASITTVPASITTVPASTTPIVPASTTPDTDDTPKDATTTDTTRKWIIISGVILSILIAIVIAYYAYKARKS